MAFRRIKDPRLPECLNRVLGAEGHGILHTDLGFLSSGGLHLTWAMQKSLSYAELAPPSGLRGAPLAFTAEAMLRLRNGGLWPCP
jgi:hypothetical protein